MASVVCQRVGGNTYLYESVSCRNRDGRLRSRRIPIGKPDKKTGLPVYKQEYIDRMTACGTPLE